MLVNNVRMVVGGLDPVVYILMKQLEKSQHTCFLMTSILSSLLSRSRIMKKVRLRIRERNKVNPVRYL